MDELNGARGSESESTSPFCQRASLCFDFGHSLTALCLYIRFKIRRSKALDTFDCILKVAEFLCQ